ILFVRRVPGLHYARQRAAHFRDGPTCRTEIQKHRAAISAHEDIVGRDVPVQKIVRVHHLESSSKGATMRSSSSCEGGLPKLRSHASKPSPSSNRMTM